MKEWFVVEERRGDIFFDAYESEEDAKNAMVWDFKRRDERERMQIKKEKGLYVAHNASGEEVGSAEWFEGEDAWVELEDALRAREDGWYLVNDEEGTIVEYPDKEWAMRAMERAYRESKVGLRVVHSWSLEEVGGEEWEKGIDEVVKVEDALREKD